MQVDLEKLTSLADSVSAPFGLDVLEVKSGQQGKRRTIEVTIYRRAGRISLDDCEQVSRAIEERLEQEPSPLLDNSFVLEVQSPGIDRKLSTEREFAIFTGLPVDVKTKQNVEGLGCDFTATLIGLDGSRVVLSEPKKLMGAVQSKRKAKPQKLTDKRDSEIPQTLEIELSEVIHVRLHPIMPKPEDQGEASIGSNN